VSKGRSPSLSKQHPIFSKNKKAVTKIEMEGICFLENVWIWETSLLLSSWEDG